MSLLAQANADARTFFDPVVGFGTAATFARASAPAVQVPINVSFDQAFEAQQVGKLSRDTRALTAVESSLDQVSFRTDDWPDAEQGDAITIGTTVYRILDPCPDGLGVTVATLTEGTP